MVLNATTLVWPAKASVAQVDAGNGGHGDSDDGDVVELPTVAAALDTAAPTTLDRGEPGSNERARLVKD